MKQIIRIIFLSFITLVFFVACEKIQYELPTGSKQLIFDFSTETTFEFSLEENTSSVAFKSNFSWIAEVDEQATSWLTVSQMNGKPGEAKITFNVTKNEEQDTRVGHITLYAGDSSFVITVKQSAADFIFERDEEGNIKTPTLHLDAYKQDTSYSFYANVEWTATVNEEAQEWIHTEASGLKEKTQLLIKVEKNRQTTERTGKVTVQSANNTFDINIIQEQGGEEFTYNRDLTFFFFAYDDQSPKKLNFNAHVNWTATLTEADAAWISVEPASGSAGDNIELSMTVVKNLDFSQRIGKVSITGRDCTFIVNITQIYHPAFEYQSKLIKYSFPFATGGEYTFTFTAYVDTWEIADEPPFVVTPKSGGKGGPHTLTISCPAGDQAAGEQGGEARTLRLRGGGQSITFDCVRTSASE